VKKHQRRATAGHERVDAVDRVDIDREPPGLDREVVAFRERSDGVLRQASSCRALTRPSTTARRCENGPP
jgi:hypothetical protein